MPVERCNVRRLGDVQIVLSSTAKPQRGQSVEIQKLLVTNAMKLSAAEVVTQYNLRWQIELFFKELKSTLRLDHYRSRDFLKVERWVAVCLLTFLYLEELQFLQQRIKTSGGIRRLRNTLKASAPLEFRIAT